MLETFSDGFWVGVFTVIGAEFFVILAMAIYSYFKGGRK